MNDRITDHEAFVCHVYVNTALSRGELREMVKAYVNGLAGTAQSATIESASVEVMLNKRILDPTLPPKSFVDWPVYLEVSPREQPVKDEYLTFVAQLVVHLHQRGYSVRCACDHEDEIQRRIAALLEE